MRNITLLSTHKGRKLFNLCGETDVGLAWQIVTRPGKSCKLSSSGKFRALQCPQNSVIRNKGRNGTCALNVVVV